MSVPIYILSLEKCLADLGEPEPFRAHQDEWKKIGLGTIVDRVTGNGTLVRQDDGRYRLAVWPEGESYPVGDPTTLVEVDEELTVGWIGDTPGPDDLDNGNPLHLQTCGVRLCDGNVWEVPEVRERWITKLPTDLVKDRKTGKLLNPIKREYLDLWTESEYWFSLLLDGEGSFEWSRALDYATRLLSLRYRFCDATQSALRVIDSTNVLDIVKASLSWQAVLDYASKLSPENGPPQKKSPSDPVSVKSSGSSGPADSAQTTAPHAGNSGSPSDISTGDPPDG